MKTKAKLTLAISIMSAAVLAAGVTSTFAWLTTQSTATLGTGVMTVSTVSSIQINVEKLGFDVSTATSTGGFNTNTTKVTDDKVLLGAVSSTDGDTFYAPKTLRSGGEGDGYVDTDFAAVDKKTNWNNTNAHVGYVKYGIHVIADADVGAYRYLNFKITPTVTDTELTAAYRVALLNATYNTSTSSFTSGAAVGIYGATNANSSAWDNTGTSADTLKTTTYAKEAISTVAAAKPLASGAADVTTTTDVDESKISTKTDIDRYYILSVWVEGADGNATNDGISGETLKVDLEFSLV